MTSPTEPPRLATWVLTRIAQEDDPMVGDLIEEYGRRGSPWWYRGQVLQALFVYMPRQVRATSLVLALYATGTYITIPGARHVLQSLVERRASGPGPWQPFSVFFLGGNQMAWGTVFTLGINPYISAAFLVQILQLLWIVLHWNASNRRRLPVVAVTWCVAILLCLGEAGGFAAFLERASRAGTPFVDAPGWIFRMTALLTLTTGTILLMFISDQISKHQMGNGMLIVFLAATLTAMPAILRLLLSGAVDPVGITLVLAVNIGIAGLVSYGYQRAIVRELVAG